MKGRPGGWQRLGVVLSVVWLAVAALSYFRIMASYGASSLPQKADFLFRWEEPPPPKPPPGFVLEQPTKPGEGFVELHPVFSGPRFAGFLLLPILLGWLTALAGLWIRRGFPDGTSGQNRALGLALAVAIGVLAGCALVIAFRPITGPPFGTFWVRFLLPFLTILISWQVAALIIALLFRKPLAELLPRLIKGPWGTEFEAALAQADAQKREREKSVTVPLSGVAAVGSVGRLDAVIDAPTATARGEVRVPSVSPNTTFDASALPPPVATRFQFLKSLASDEPTEQRLDRALAALADLEIQNGFEKIYRVITGSQLDALLHLHALPQGMSREELEGVYRRNPETSKVFPLDSWLGYLTWVGLAASNPAGKIQITPLGELFLQYLYKQGYTLPKPL